MKQSIKKQLVAACLAMYCCSVAGADTNPSAATLHVQTTKSVRLVLAQEPGSVVGNVGRVFARQVQQRCDAKVVADGTVPLTVELAVEKGIGAEGYRIEDRKGGGVRIAGNDERGLVAGVGKLGERRVTTRAASRPARGVARRFRRSRSAASTLPPISTTSITRRLSMKSSGMSRTSRYGG